MFIDGQFGSTGKGAMAAWVAYHSPHTVNMAFTNAAPNAGHTSIVQGVKRVAYHLPTVALVHQDAHVCITAGAAVDPALFFQEIETLGVHPYRIAIHPMAAVITKADKDAEGNPESGPASIASTQKGVGNAFGRRMMRSAEVARDRPELAEFVGRWSPDSYVDLLARGGRAAMEIPQGIDLSLTGRFYPHCTSRNVSIGQALSDLQMHPSVLGKVAMSMRTFPIRVGNLDGRSSGGCWEDQEETSWEAIGQTPEVTTVTGRIRRVFTWSNLQLMSSLDLTHPDLLWLGFCDYLDEAALDARLETILRVAASMNMAFPIITSYGPAVEDARVWAG
jgi:adenylosuccinate synthase